MTTIGWTSDEKDRKIYLVGSKREAEKIRTLVLTDIEIPDRVNFLFNTGDFGSLCEITCFSKIDFERMRQQLKRCIR